MTSWIAPGDEGPGFSDRTRSRGTSGPPAQSGGSTLKGCATGCAVVVLSAFVVGMIWLSSIRIGPGDGPTPYPVTIASRWAAQDVVLSPAHPLAVFRITFQYGSTSGQAVTPEAVAAAPAYDTPDPSSAGSPATGVGIDEPAVRMELLNGENANRPCAAPCEDVLTLPACSSLCTATVDVQLSLVDSAGRDEIKLTLRSGLSVAGGSPLPDGFDVKIGPVPPSTYRGGVV